VFGPEFAFALTAGAVAAFNPCGFAMLPAYLSVFVADPGAIDAPAWVRIRRALLVGGSVTAGFLVVFGIVGVVVTEVTSSVYEVAPWISIVIGLAMVVLGAAMVLGYELKVGTPRVQRGGSSTLRGMVLYGVSYATVSLGCTLPIFAGVIGTGFDDEGLLAGSSRFIAYALGMGLVVVVLSIAVALAQQAFVRRVRGLLPMIGRISGAFLVVAGLYVALYGWYERQVLAGRDDVAGSGIVERVTDLSAELQDAVRRLDTDLLYLGIAIVGLVALWVVLRGRSTRQRGDGSS
jgi:cytochrome c biogenesis protein CcdA